MSESDIRRWPRPAPRAGHDIAGPGLHLDFPIAQVRTAVTGQCLEVVMWHRTEKSRILILFRLALQDGKVNRLSFFYQKIVLVGASPYKLQTLRLCIDLIALTNALDNLWGSDELLL